VELDDPLGQGEPEPGALGRGRLAAALLERLEDPLAVLGSDPGPGVGDGDQHLAPVGQRPHVDPSTVGGELHRVGEQVDDDLLDPELVRLNQPDLGGHVQTQGDAVPAGPLPHQGEAMPERVLEGELGRLKDHLPRLDLGQVEDLVEQLQQVPPGAPDQVDDAFGPAAGRGPADECPVEPDPISWPA
jgi:hypothetical protein